jgi:hypothetical protein
MGRVAEKIMEHADKPTADEHAHQVAIFAWASQSEHRDLLRWMHAIPNGGDRDRVVAGQLKAEGVKSGVWDIFLPLPRGNYHGLYIELKRPGREKEPNGGLSDTQVSFGEHAHYHGYATKLCHGWRPAVAAIVGYLNTP